MTAEVLRAFEDKAIVRQAEKTDGRRIQGARIVWNRIGEAAASAKGE